MRVADCRAHLIPKLHPQGPRRGQHPWFLAGVFAGSIAELLDASGLEATAVADPFSDA